MLSVVLVYTLPQRKIMRFKLSVGSLLLLQFFFIFILTLPPLTHTIFRRKASPFPLRRGEKQTSSASNFSSSYILKCPLYYPPHCIPVCSLEMAVTRRLQLLLTYGEDNMMSMQIAWPSPRFLDPVVSSCDGRCCLQKWTVIPGTYKLFLLIPDNEKQVKNRWFQQVKRYQA